MPSVETEDGAMVRIAKKTDPKRIAELKKKIQNKDYMAAAVQRIAQILAREILNQRGE
jgi:hypothetical protein